MSSGILSIADDKRVWRDPSRRDRQLQGERQVLLLAGARHLLRRRTHPRIQHTQPQKVSRIMQVNSGLESNLYLSQIISDQTELNPCQAVQFIGDRL